ncbi:AraC family transcriptional regulator [Kineosporia succinea]|uniref:AraC-like DNA-binding protein n=1 Tax=Kineosporia succinea TaxID=84632 RepID=A0ABT9PA05_9ACTN|nr:AraC family transcriptional regulator [Kineosporia succinea]MDP9829528.1 AraC-like DNA-binding protein [Kineosporia succinea]
MDLISDAVAGTRAGRAVGSRHRHTGSWSSRFPAVNGSGLHIVRRGAPYFVHEHGQPFRTRAGDVVFVPHGGRHGFSDAPLPFGDLSSERPAPVTGPFDTEFVSCCYHLDHGQVSAWFDGLPEVLTVNTDDAAAGPMLGHLAGLLEEHAADDGEGSDIALAAIVDLLLVHLLRAWREHLEPAPDPQILAALRAVQEDPSRPWTVQDLCDRAGLSRTTFTRRFAALTHETPRRYLLRRRLEHAGHLLRHTDLPLAAIARQLGYSSEFSFSAAFRRTFQIAPGQYRLQQARTAEPPVGHHDGQESRSRVRDDRSGAPAAGPQAPPRGPGRSARPHTEAAATP